MECIEATGCCTCLVSNQPPERPAPPQNSCCSHSMASSSSSQQGQKRNRQEQEVDPSCTCAVCMEVLLDPVTPPCGHPLDRRCMQKLVDAGGRRACPTCRDPLPVQLPRVTVNLRDMVQQRYPEQVRRENLTRCGGAG